MPDTYRVILAAEALRELEGIAHYISQHSPQNAAIVAETVCNAIDSLALMPARFRRVGKSRERGSPIHAMVVRPFIVYYRVEDEPAVVYIFAIRHGSRQQPRRFE